MSSGEPKISDALGVGAPEGDALRASSERAQAVRSAVQACIDALSAHVAILDEAGNILAINERWAKFADSNQLISPRHAMGDNYLAVCDGSAAAGDATAANVAAGIRSVISGEQPNYATVYPCHGTAMQRWFRLDVTRFFDGGEMRVIASHEDVTQLVEAGEALRESEARFRGVFESDVLPMSFWTADGKITDANDAYLRMVGYTREELEAGKLKWNELTVSDYLHLDHAAIRELKQSGYCTPYEKEYQLRDGRRVPVLLAGAVLPGPAEHGIAFTIDLTERRRAQQALEQSERRFRGIFESATVAIWEADFSDVLVEIVRVRSKDAAAMSDFPEYVHTHPEWVADCFKLVRVLSVNDAAVKMMGARDRAELALAFPDHFLPDLIPCFMKKMIALAEERSEVYCDTPFHTLSGELRYQLMTVSLPPTTSITNVVISVVDVTDRRRVQEALRATEELNRAVLSSLTEQIAVLDRDGKILAVNDAWQQFVEDGGAPPALVGRDANYLAAVANVACDGSAAALASAAAATAGIRAVLDGSQDHFEHEFTCISPRGSRSFVMSVVPLRGQSPGGAVVVHTDMTDRKRAQDLLRALNARLIHVQEEERRHVARELHDDLTQRIAVLAIEIGKLELEMRPLDPEHAAELRRMNEEMAKLSSDVHALSHKLHPSMLDDLGLLVAMEGECNAFSRREKIDLRFRTEGINGDVVPGNIALCVFRVMQEALRNVAKHAKATSADVSLVCRDGVLTLTVSDSGAGFDPVEQQAQRAIQNLQGGGSGGANGGAQHGLGLASMRERAGLVGGKLSIESAPGKGTTVRMSVALERKPS